MSICEQLIRIMEDYILAEKDLFATSCLEFEHGGKTERGYPYIRSGNGPFETALRNCSRLIPKPLESICFLEVGCGIGTKCAIANLLGMRASGIDFKLEYVAIARDLFQQCQFQHANALTFDYSSFDIVYYHIPVVGDALLFELECKVLTQLPTGAVLICTQLSETICKKLFCDSVLRSEFETQLVELDFDLGRLRLLQKTAAIDEQQLLE